MRPTRSPRLGGVLSNGAYAGSTLLGSRVSRADFNGDGFVDFFDYGDFAAAFEAGDPRSDFNRDGFIDFFDYSDFVTAFEQGC